MVFGEPDRTTVDLNFQLFGFPVRVHPLFWLVTVFIFVRQEGELPDYVNWVAAVFISILIHELGHAFAMRSYGFSPHIVLYAMGGLASYGSGYQSRALRTWPQIIISAAGPLAGFALAGAILMSLVVAGFRDQIYFVGPLNLVPLVVDIGRERLAQFINFVCWISVFWGIVNLLPVYPLDGGHIAREALLALQPRRGIENSLMLSIVVAVGMAAYAALVLHLFFGALFFGYLAYSSYQILEGYRHGGRW